MSNFATVNDTKLTDEQWANLRRIIEKEMKHNRNRLRGYQDVEDVCSHLRECAESIRSGGLMTCVSLLRKVGPNKYYHVLASDPSVFHGKWYDTTHLCGGRQTKYYEHGILTSDKLNTTDEKIIWYYNHEQTLYCYIRVFLSTVLPLGVFSYFKATVYCPHIEVRYKDNRLLQYFDVNNTLTLYKYGINNEDMAVFLSLNKYSIKIDNICDHVTVQCEGTDDNKQKLFDYLRGLKFTSLPGEKNDNAGVKIGENIICRQE